MTTVNRRIKNIEPIVPPSDLRQGFPVTEKVDELVRSTRRRIGDILHGRDSRLLVITGPCSIHDIDAAVEYATRLLPLRERYADRLEIVMRVYFEKPRTTIGWKGLINDPLLDQSFNINLGLETARKLLLDLNEMGIPAACEFLDAVTGQYYADLVSWGAIGARTTESQVHREIASGLSCPVGFKNGTNGNVQIAVDAVLAARASHRFLSPDDDGSTALFTTAGNEDAHVILRGGLQPNYDAESVAAARSLLNEKDINAGIIVDCSHANSQKQYAKQADVADAIAVQISSGSAAIVGCMLESHLVAGKQKPNLREKLVYGQSITDACIDLETTAEVLETLATVVNERIKT